MARGAWITAAPREGRRAGGALAVEVHEDVVHHHGQWLGAAAELLDQAEAQREVELLSGPAAQLVGRARRSALRLDTDARLAGRRDDP